MPDRLFIASKYPPTLSDRLHAHRWEFIIAALSFFCGIAVIADQFFNPWVASSVIGELPGWQAFSLGSLFLTGSALAMFTILEPSPPMAKMRRKWRQNQTAWILLSPAWFSVVILTLYSDKSSFVGAMIYLALSLGAIAEVRATQLTEKRSDGIDNGEG